MTSSTARSYLNGVRIGGRTAETELRHSFGMQVRDSFISYIGTGNYVYPSSSPQPQHEFYSRSQLYYSLVSFLRAGTQVNLP